MSKNNGDSGRSAVRMIDIAKRCGVSLSTVSRAFQGDDKQTKETNERILAVAKEMGYDPFHGRAGRRLASSRSDKPMLNNAVGLMFPLGMDYLPNYFISILEGILMEAGGAGFEVQISPALATVSRDRLPIAYRSGEIDGVLTLAQEHYWVLLRDRLRNEPNFVNRPVVNLIQPLEGCSSVHPDNYRIGYLAVSHLLDLGHRHILQFIASEEMRVHYDAHGARLRGYHDAVRERGLDPERTLVFHRWTFGDIEGSSRKLIEDLSLHPEVTAIVTRNDEQATQIYEALLSAGYSVPEDISIIGCDDSECIVDRNRENVLTTVALPLKEIGREGVRLLLRRILGEEPEDRDIVLPVELVVRMSTAPPRKSTS